MWAIIETGGKQYRVGAGDKLETEKIEGEVGSSIVFDRVLLLSKDAKGKEISLGTPYLEKTEVQAKILSTQKNKKVLVFKYKPKKRYRVKKGHRQQSTTVEIGEIKMV